MAPQEGLAEKVKAESQQVIDMLGAESATEQLIDHLAPSQMMGALSSVLAKLMNSMSNTLLEGLEAPDGPGVPADHPVKIQIKQFNEVTKGILSQNHFRAMQSTGALIPGKMEQLFVPLYEEGTDAHQSITDNHAKSLSTYEAVSHSGTNQDLLTEAYLTRLYSMAKQNNLSHKACSALLLRKLGPSTLMVLQQHFRVQNILEQDLTLQDLATYMEQTYMRNSSPRNSYAQLQAFAPKLVTSENYLTACAQIQRLSKLSCRDNKNKEQRELLESSRAIEKFRAVLGQHDKDFLITEEKKIIEMGFPELTLPRITQLLVERSDHKSHQTGSESAFKAHEEEQDYFNQDPGDRAFWVNRDRRPSVKPARNSHARGKGQGGEYDPPPRDTNFPPGRGGNQPGKFQADREPKGRQGDRHERYDAKNKRVFVTTKMANVPENTCIMCADPSHRYKNENCPYREICPLALPNPCPRCKVGAHSSETCLKYPKARKFSSQPKIKHFQAKFCQHDEDGASDAESIDLDDLVSASRALSQV
jgi:hypothetical protein